MSSRLATTKRSLRRMPQRTQRDLSRDGQEQHGEEAAQRDLGQRLRDEDPGGDTADRGDADDESRAPAHVPVALLAPRAGGDGREDREERGRLGRALRESEREQRRHEERSAAHPEQTREDAGDEPAYDGAQGAAIGPRRRKD